MEQVVVISFTTLYRLGGEKFRIAARTLANEKATKYSGLKIICQPVESKKEFLDLIDSIAKAGQTIKEFHFIGHSGVYGIMFGTTDWPEQFSPYEWSQQKWPLAKNSELFFHACRTARWFAPYLANHFKVKVYGYWWYTSISASKEKLYWSIKDKAYIVSCPGRKSHGWIASLLKYSGFAKLYPLIAFQPEDKTIDKSYDQVSNLYEDTFEDLRVRKDEWTWFQSKIDFSKKPSLLDIGCGNAAFLRQIADKISIGHGVDASAGMLKVAKEKSAKAHLVNLNFTQLNSPKLPFDDNQFDYVISSLSFRYLDWDPMIHEILRVLKPGGQILILDMVAAPVSVKDIPLLLYSKVRHYIQRFQNPKYYAALEKMVKSHQWQQMLKYNPIRAEHEYRWYLLSRFPNSDYGCINIGWNSRIITFASKPLYIKEVQKMSYP